MTPSLPTRIGRSGAGTLAAWLIAFVALAPGALLPMAAQAKAGDNATLTVLHGLPNFTADVYVNGALLLDGFQPESATDPLSLPPGKYDVAIRETGAAANAPPVLKTSLRLEAGANYTAVAHLTAEGGNTVSLFKNNASSIPPGKSRLMFRDVASAPQVSVLVDGNSTFKGVASGRSRGSVIVPGRHSVELVSDGGSALLPSQGVTLHEGAETYLYLIGSADDQTLDLMFQEVAAVGSSPAGVNAGDGGLAAPSGFPRWAVALMGLSALLALACIRLLSRRRPAGAL
jgi:hypothetical protein